MISGNQISKYMACSSIVQEGLSSMGLYVEFLNY